MKSLLFFFLIIITSHLIAQPNQIETSDIYYSPNITVIGNGGNFLEPYSGFNTQNNKSLQIHGNTIEYGIPSIIFSKSYQGNNHGGGISWMSNDYVTSDRRFALIDARSTNQEGSLFFRTRKNTDPSGYFNNMVLDQNGNVGIGTETPTSRLEVSNTGDGAELLKLSTERPWVFRQTKTAGKTELDLNSTVNHKVFKITSPNGSTNAHFYVADDAGKDRVSLIPDGGKVLIGSVYGDEMLTVAGTIHSREVKVDVQAGTGPDYVFDEDYNLTSLEEIEAFIQSEKHLPEVPSAKEMEANGVQLGEMNMLLLKKVEELTLYTIEQEKKLANQSRDNSELRIQNGELTQTLNDLLKRIEKLESK